MATKAFKTGVSLDRQDERLKFGSTTTFSAATTYPCGYSASYTDGVILDAGNTDFEGMSVVFKVEAEITGTGTVGATFKVLSSNDNGSNWAEIASAAAPALTAGTLVSVPLPYGYTQGNLIKAAVTTAGTTVTGGKVSAWVDTYTGV